MDDSDGIQPEIFGVPLHAEEPPIVVPAQRDRQSSVRANSFSDVNTAHFPGWGLDGQELHGLRDGGGVPIKRWCCTRDDLVFLRADVRKAIDEEDIQPTTKDPFDPLDDVVGPNMYTVCDEYVKPLTKMAGSMSWALMRNPKGLQCDLFITHAWVEGIFEFIDKTLTSWPRGKIACYICILSNPQNLDIAELIKTPKNSPFALCLESASHMLVIPNHTTSIYSRLWCVYEAWLAFKTKKVILTANSPVRSKIMKALSILCVPFAIVAAPTAAFADGCPVDDGAMKGYLTYGLVQVFFAKPMAMCQLISPRMSSQLLGRSSRFLAPFPHWLAWNIIGVCWNGMLLAIDGRMWSDGCHDTKLTWGFRWCAMTWVIYFFGSEADRIVAIRESIGAAELRNNFTAAGDAQCSCEQDREHITAEIREDLAEVDMAISVLLCAGMSTPKLCLAASRGANINSASHVSFASLVACIGSYILTHVLFFSVADEVVTSGGKAAWLILHFIILISAYALVRSRRTQDEKAYIFAVVSKLMLVFLAVLFLSISESYPVHSLPVELGIMSALCAWISLVFSSLGVSGIAKVPRIGPLLASILGPGSTCGGFRRLSNSEDSIAWSNPFRAPAEAALNSVQRVF
eukprot:TRINITY_DN74701_c0_g1_i1.p1 TRINITY_DN74701_c0_g1~~TRINITY_DN74701_c0_g1_i1.p1  ORF type:complete len:630 (+),score=42.23 TRINITY_DN74701_c0_g1_i1:55-1944(+)